MNTPTLISIEQMPVPTLVVDLEGIIVEINDSAEIITGFLKEELVGRSVEC